MFVVLYMIVFFLESFGSCVIYPQIIVCSMLFCFYVIFTFYRKKMIQEKIVHFVIIFNVSLLMLFSDFEY
jgi:hypothetical protein